MTGRTSIALLLGVGALNASCTTSDGPPPLMFQEGRQAASAKDFVDTVGVNVHLNYVDTAYADFDRVRAALRDLGVTRVREGLVKDRPEFIARLEQLAEDGVRYTFVMGEPLHGGPEDSAGTVEELHDLLRTSQLLPSVDALEGANEYDLDAPTNPAWRQDLRRHQRQLFDVVNGDPRTADIPVLAPSFAIAESHEQVGSLSSVADLGNAHLYTGGVPLTPEHLRDAQARSRLVNEFGPVVLTETGYHNAVEAPVSPDAHLPTSEEAAASYVPQQYLEAFAAGVRRTYAYELLDQRPGVAQVDAEASFGLLRADFSRKPAFDSLKEMLVLLGTRDSTEYSPGKLDWRMSGDDASVRSLLLQRGDGRFFLALWSSAQVWDPVSRESLPAPSRRVELAISQPLHSARMHVLDGRVEDGREVPDPARPVLDVGPQVTLLELVPAA